MKFFSFFKRKDKQSTTFKGIANLRAFQAAEVDRLVAKWQWDGGFSNSEVLSSLSTIRSRSRDMAKNSPLYARYISLFRENVVGDGFRFKSLPFKSEDNPTDIDRDAARAIEYHWWRWSSESSMVDVSQRLNLTQMLALVAENWARDGEAFIVIDRHAQNRYGLSLRVIRPDCIDEAVNHTDHGICVRGGIEYDVFTSRPLAYWFDSSKADECAVLMGDKYRRRIPAEDVIHLFEMRDADQLRGVPLGHVSIKTMKMLDEYNKSELVAARDEACTIGFFSAPSGQEGAMEMDGETAGAMRDAVTAGEKMILPNGWIYNSNTPQHPNREWGAYNVALQRFVCVGLGADFAEITGNGEGTISAVARQSILRTREMWKYHQRTMAASVLDKIFDAWLKSFLSLSVSGRAFSSSDFNRLRDHVFQGRRWGWIDPTAEVNAAVAAVAHGWRTDAEIAAEYGTDIDDNIVEMGRIKTAKEAAGLLTIGNGLGSMSAAEVEKASESEAQELSENGEHEDKPVEKKAAARKRSPRKKKEAVTNG